MVLVGRPGYKIGSRTMKGLSRVSSLMVSFIESLNLCIVGIIFLGSCLVFLFVSFGAFGLLLDKLKFIKNGFRLLHLVFFLCWSLCRFFTEGGFAPI